MRCISVWKVTVLVSIFAACAGTVACGAGPYELPAAISNVSVASTQNPLVASFNMQTVGCPGQVMVEFGPDTSYGRSTAWYPIAGYQQTSSILVAGMKASTAYHMQAVAQCSGTGATLSSGDFTFTTGPLPAIAFPSLAVSRPDHSSSSPENPGIEMIDITTASVPALFTDRDANPIWYYDVGPGNYAFTFKLLSNGHMLLSILQPTVSLLREVDLAGNIIRELDMPTLDAEMGAAGFDFLPGTFHHDFVPLPNGHLIVLANFTKNFTDLPGYPGTTAVIGDGLIDLDQNWNPVWAWNSFDHLDVTRHLNGLPDWTHSNAIVYSPSDGNLLLSMRHQSWVLKIDYDNGAGTGDIIWELGYQGNPGFAMNVDGAASDDPSEWFSFQHYPEIISQSGSETTLAIWDNGDYRVLDTNGTLCGGENAPACYSRATIFQIDESAMVANLLWAEQEPNYGIWGGSINQLADGNVEFDLNAPAFAPGPNVGSQIQEVTQTSTPQVVWQMDVSTPSNAYRGYRVPSLYPNVTWQY